MRFRSSSLRLEELESRLLLSLPSSAPPLGAPPSPSSSVVWVGTESALQTAVKNLQSGQTIVIQKGTYNLSQTLAIGNNRNLTNVTIRGATDNYNDVVLLGKGMENANYGNVPLGIQVDNAQGVTIENLSIGQVYFHPIELQGVANAQKVHIYHVRLFDAGEQFIKSNPGGPAGGVDNSSVEYSVMEYTNGPPTINHGGGTGYTNGVDVHTGANWIISNNLFRNFHTPDTSQNKWNPAVLIWNHSSNAIVDGNTFINTDRAIAFGLVLQTTGYDNQGGIIRNNFVYLSPGLFSAARKQGADGQIIVWDSPGTKVYQNTVVTSGNTYDSIQARWATTGLDIRNNLADAPLGARDGATYTAAGNYLHATASMFVNPTAGDLHLVSNAATLASVIGKVPTLAAAPLDFDGQARPTSLLADIGADEYSATGPFVVTGGKSAAGSGLATPSLSGADTTTQQTDALFAGDLGLFWQTTQLARQAF